jgi:hypothetical protein
VGIKNGVFKSALFYCGGLKPPLFFSGGDLAVQINRFLEWVNRPYLDLLWRFASAVGLRARVVAVVSDRRNKCDVQRAPLQRIEKFYRLI